MCCPDEVIATTDETMAIVCLVLNIILPGVGTMVNAYYSKYTCTGICFGILQMITSIILIGWVWSIVYGVKIMNKSKDERYTHSRSRGRMSEL